MPFDSLPSHNLQIPEYHPTSVTVMPKPSIWPGIAQGAAGLGGILAKALDPTEKAKEKLALAQLSFQTKALQDYQSSKDSGDFYIGPNGLPVRLTPIQKQQMQVRALNMRKQQIYLQHQNAVDGANKGDPNFTHASEFESLLPQQPETTPEVQAPLPVPETATLD